MPALVTAVTNTGGAGDITLHHQYAENGKLSGTAFYMNGALVASAEYGSDGTVYRSQTDGIDWTLETGYKWNTHSSEDPEGPTPPVEVSVKIEYPKALRVGGTVYEDLSSDAWKSNPEIISFNQERIISFILRDISERNLIY
jgi:hypothetical protein